MERNRILLGDAYGLINELPDDSVDLIVTDPPFSMGGGGFTKPSEGRWYSRNYAHEINEQSLHNGFDYSLLDDLVRVMKRINIYIWCSHDQLIPLIDYFVEQKGCRFDILIWHKTNPSPFFNGTYLNDKEYCLFFKEPGVKLNTTYETAASVFMTSVNKTDKDKYSHPTIKPEPIIENLIRNSCPEGGLVFDPFVGSGTTCAVAKRLGYDYLGFELNPKWHAVAVDRLNGITKKQRDAGIEQLKLF